MGLPQKLLLWAGPFCCRAYQKNPVDFFECFSLQEKKSKENILYYGKLFLHCFLPVRIWYNNERNTGDGHEESCRKDTYL